MKIEILERVDAEMKEYLGIKKKYAEDEIVLVRINGEVRNKKICLFVPIKEEVKNLPSDEFKKMMKVVLGELAATED